MMATLDELKQIKKFVADSARRKKDSDRLKTEQKKSDSISSAVGNKKKM